MESIEQQNISYQVLEVHPSSDMEITLHNVTVQLMEPDNFQFVLFKVVTPLIFGIITLLGLLGNSLVIHVIRARRNMKTVTNLLLLNLAVADLTFLLICPPFTAYQYAAFSWPVTGLLGDILCKLFHYLLNVTVYVTIYSLVLISVIRYLTIVHNSSTVSLRTKRNTVITIVLLWCILLVVNIPLLFSYGLQTYETYTFCQIFALVTAQQIYATMFAFAYILPLCMIAVFYLCILRHIRMHSSTTLNMNKKSNKKKKQATRLIFLVIVIFAIFWIPVHVCLLVDYYYDFSNINISSKLLGCIDIFCKCLAYSNSCVNPFIYNFTSKDFRDSFRATVLCVKQTQDRDRKGSPVKKISKALAEEVQ